MMPPPRLYYLTGRQRLAPAGGMVVLQLEEATKYPHMPDVRWRNATPQDVMAMVSVQIEPAKLKVST